MKTMLFFLLACAVSALAVSYFVSSWKHDTGTVVPAKAHRAQALEE